MATIVAHQESTISAPADTVYRILANYTEHHPQILPPAFSEFRVEEGGTGAGTIISFKVTMGGQTTAFRQRVDEPKPGRVLTETDLRTGGVTTFTVTPRGEHVSHVSIETRSPASGGVKGMIEKIVAPRMLAKLYAAELAKLDDYARTI